MNFKSKNKKFTLIELIVVIAVIAILAAIILPNISDMTAKATVSAIKGNARNIQTASDMYSYDFGNKATLTQPEYGVPKQFDYNKLYPDYLRKNCKDIKENYWVDNNGIVQGSVIKPPKVNELSGTSLTWENSLNAVSYNVYKDVNGKQVLFKENAVSPATVEAGELYFVSAVDRYNFETPAVSYKYDPSNDEKNCTHSGTDTGNPNDGNDTETPTDGENIIKVGDFLVLGEYNGQPLEWVVLKKDSNGLYLFNASNVNELKTLIYSAQRDSTWETSDAREFLNNEFYNNAFNSYEKSLIKSSSYKSYVYNETLADGGSDVLEYSYDWYDRVLETNEDDAYYRYTIDNISLPSITDSYTTDLFLYVLNTFLEMNDIVSYYTRDSNDERYVYSIDVDLDFVEHSWTGSWYDNIARPVMYIKSDAVPTGGNGTNESPYVFDGTIASPMYTKLIKKYDDIIVTDDMFPTTIVEPDRYGLLLNGTPIKTIKLDIPEEYKDETLLLTMTIEKTYEGGISLMALFYECEEEERRDYWYTILTTAGSSYEINLLKQKSAMSIKNDSIGTYKFFYTSTMDMIEFDLVIGRINNNTHGFKIKDMKLEQLIYK